MSNAESSARSSLSPLWQRALDYYQEDLREDDDFILVQEVSSLDQLLEYATTLETTTSLDSFVIGLPERLKYVDDFAAVVALTFGADAKLTAFIWGSIRLLLSLACSYADLFKDVLGMLEGVSKSLPQFRPYEPAVPANQSLQESLVDLYTEIICFYARAIRFFYRIPHARLLKANLKYLKDDFDKTTNRIRKLSSSISVEIKSSHTRYERSKPKEVLNLTDTTHPHSMNAATQKKQYYCVPVEASARFYGREQILETLGGILNPNDTRQLQSCTLYGLGGIGKTEIAHQYIARNRRCFDGIFWVAADSIISTGQSFLDIAKELELLGNVDEQKDTANAISRVKDRLVRMDQPWLLVLDNADELSILKQIWPVGGQGSLLITTRDAGASQLATSESIDVQSFDDETGSKALLDMVGIKNASSADQANALQIVQALGSLPLAINQLGSFMAQRRLPLRDFLPLYEKNAAKINSRKLSCGSYERTLSTVWELAIRSLSGDDRQLLDLLPFFCPDMIYERILLEGSDLLENSNFDFLHDMMDLGNAEETLLKYSLINKNMFTSTLSVHRLVQAEVLSRQEDAQKAQNVAAVVKMLTWGFPDTWSQDVGHQVQAWSNCEICLPHVNHLQKLYKRGRIAITNRHEFAELLLRCSWYLYEQESYLIGKDMVTTALDLFENRDLAYASAIDLSGLIDLDLNRPQDALSQFRQAYELRLQLKGPLDPLIALSLNNFALAYTEMDMLSEAHQAHEQAISIRKVFAIDRIGNSYSNMSSLLLKMRKPNEAEQMLMQCPSLQNFTDDTFLKTGNPRFSGDMVLLSRIRAQQGRLDDALRLSSKALSFRERVCGNKLKTCDSIYDVASLLHKHDKTASAIDFLHQLIDRATCIPEGEGQLARGYFKLSLLLEEIGRQAEADAIRAKAVETRAASGFNDAGKLLREEDFDRLCLWMLW